MLQTGSSIEQSAVEDIFSALPEGPDTINKASLLGWQPDFFINQYGHVKRVDLKENLIDSEACDEALNAAQSFTDNNRQKKQEPVLISLNGQYLVVQLRHAMSHHLAYLAVLTAQQFADFLQYTFPKIHLSPALQRLLLLHIAGISLKDGATLDNRSINTRKTQSIQLRSAFAIDDLSTLGRNVSNALVIELDRYISFHSPPVGQSITAYVDRYLPKEVRVYALTESGGRTVTLLDMGPLDGHPVLTLHAMTLPDICQHHIALLHTLKLRLIWPLRYGLCSPNTQPQSHQEHISHAVRGASMAMDIICGGRASVLAFTAASKIGIELALARPQSVDALHVAGVCVRQGRPEAGPRRLAKGILTLVMHNPKLIDPILNHVASKLRNADALEQFMRRQFSGSPADISIIETELLRPFGTARFRDALLAFQAFVS